MKDAKKEMMEWMVYKSGNKNDKLNDAVKIHVFTDEKHNNMLDKHDNAVDKHNDTVDKNDDTVDKHDDTVHKYDDTVPSQDATVIK